MPFQEGCELIFFSLDAECEERLFRRWTAMYQNMMGFDEFKGRIAETVQTGEEHSAEEILETVRGIIG